MDQREKDVLAKGASVVGMFLFVMLFVDLVYKGVKDFDLVVPIVIGSGICVGGLNWIRHMWKEEISVEGIRIREERTINVVNRGAMLFIITNMGTLIVLVGFYGFRGLFNQVITEMLIVIVICSFFGIKAFLIGNIGSTYNGLEKPYYEDKEQEKKVRKRIIKNSLLQIVFWLGLDFIYMKELQSLFGGNSLVSIILVLGIQVILGILFVLLDLFIARKLNLNANSQIK